MESSKSMLAKGILVEFLYETDTASMIFLSTEFQQPPNLNNLSVPQFLQILQTVQRIINPWQLNRLRNTNVRYYVGFFKEKKKRKWKLNDKWFAVLWKWFVTFQFSKYCAKATSED